MPGTGAALLAVVAAAALIFGLFAGFVQTENRLVSRIRRRNQQASSRRLRRMRRLFWLTFATMLAAWIVGGLLNATALTLLPLGAVAVGYITGRFAGHRTRLPATPSQQ